MFFHPDVERELPRAPHPLPASFNLRQQFAYICIHDCDSFIHCDIMHITNWRGEEEQSSSLTLDFKIEIYQRKSSQKEITMKSAWTEKYAFCLA